MAIAFNEVDTYFALDPRTALSLPDGDWCLGAWVRIADNRGTEHQYLISASGDDRDAFAPNSLNLYFAERGNTTASRLVTLQVNDAHGHSVRGVSQVFAFDNGRWQLFIAQRRASAGELQVWSCAQAGTAIKRVGKPLNGLGAVEPRHWNIGRRIAGVTERWFGSECAELFVGDFSLDPSSIERLASGLPCRDLQRPLSLYFPMRRAQRLLHSEVSGHQASGHGEARTAEHPALECLKPPRSPLRHRTVRRLTYTALALRRVVRRVAKEPFKRKSAEAPDNA